MNYPEERGKSNPPPLYNAGYNDCLGDGDRGLPGQRDEPRRGDDRLVHTRVH